MRFEYVEHLRQVYCWYGTHFVYGMSLIHYAEYFGELATQRLIHGVTNQW